MSGPMTADRAQVRQMLRDIERSYMMKRAELRQQALDAERALAQQYADEMNRRAAQYGVSANAKAIGSQGGQPIGWTRGFMVESRIR